MTEPYSSRIIKASALIPDTKALLAAWDLERSTTENLQRVRMENTLGKTSRRRVTDILKILRQRYFSDPDVGAGLVTLVQGGASDAWVVPLLYFHSAQADRTLRDVVLQLIHPRRMDGHADVTVDQVVRLLRDWVAQGKTTKPWGEETIRRVAQGVMATLRDYGLLEGDVHKRMTPLYLPLPSFCLVAQWLQVQIGSGNQVLSSEEWHLFGMTVDAVERRFAEAHQEHLLAYDAAGSVVRLAFPIDTQREYARVLIEGAH